MNRGVNVSFLGLRFGEIVMFQIVEMQEVEGTLHVLCADNLFAWLEWG